MRLSALNPRLLVAALLVVGVVVSTSLAANDPKTHGDGSNAKWAYVVACGLTAISDGEVRCPVIESDGKLAVSMSSTTALTSKASSATEAQVSCGVTSTTVKAANASRLKIDYQNLSAQEVRICYAATCTVAGAGRNLTQNTAYTEANYTGAITCIVATGTATVAYSEL